MKLLEIPGDFGTAIKDGIFVCKKNHNCNDKQRTEKEAKTFLLYNVHSRLDKLLCKNSQYAQQG